MLNSSNSKKSSSTTVKSKKLKSGKTVSLSTTVKTSVEAVRFGSVSENAKIYLKEGVENLIDELQVEIAAREEAKKEALKTLKSFSDLPASCTMSEIRTRLNKVVLSLQNVFDAI